MRVPQPPPREQPPQKPDMVLLEIDRDLSMRLNETAVRFEDLGPLLQKIFAARANKNLFIRGDAELPYGDVFRVLDLAKRSGVGDVALLRKPAAGGAVQTASGADR